MVSLKRATCCIHKKKTLRVQLELKEIRELTIKISRIPVQGT
jgi:hypothetical protein